ncbi:unnamed protein product, partial [Amoebophrya sp. A25]|eukprot:GSA25T00002943001.1
MAESLEVEEKQTARLRKEIEILKTQLAQAGENGAIATTPRGEIVVKTPKQPP